MVVLLLLFVDRHSPGSAVCTSFAAASSSSSISSSWHRTQNHQPTQTGITRAVVAVQAGRDQLVGHRQNVIEQRDQCLRASEMRVRSDESWHRTRRLPLRRFLGFVLHNCWWTAGLLVPQQFCLASGGEQQPPSAIVTGLPISSSTQRLRTLLPQPPSLHPAPLPHMIASLRRCLSSRDAVSVADTFVFASQAFACLKQRIRWLLSGSTVECKNAHAENGLNGGRGDGDFPDSFCQCSFCHASGAHRTADGATHGTTRRPRKQFRATLQRNRSAVAWETSDSGASHCNENSEMSGRGN